MIHRPRLWVAIATGLALVGGLVSVDAPGAAAIGAFCEAKADLTASTFQPSAPNGVGAFGDDDNWTGDAPDLTDPSRDAGYYCVPAGTTAVMEPGDGIEAYGQLFDIAGTIDMRGGPEGPAPGGNHKIFVFGDKSTRSSTIRPSGVVNVEASSIGGPGRIDLLGRVNWKGLGTGKASTITTRPCTVNDSVPCTDPVGVAGVMVIGNGGVLDVTGSGVNLWDRYRIVTQIGGLVRLLKNTTAYIAADHGTSLELEGNASQAGVFEIQNDGGYLEGREPAFDPEPQLSRFINNGRILKSSGTRQSLISALYVPQSNGRVRVVTGTLRINTNSPIEVEALPGTTYGTGRCPEVADGADTAGNAGINCVADTNPTTPQNEAFRVPAGKNKPVTQVTIFEGGTAADAIGHIVTMHAPDLQATRRKPAIVTVRFDASVLNGRTVDNLYVYRRAAPGKPFLPLRNCNAKGKPRAGTVACIDRKKSRTVGGDVILLIRTIATSDMKVSTASPPRLPLCSKRPKKKPCRKR